MTWDYFVPFSIAALHFWGFGAFAAWRGRKPYVVGGLTLIGLAIFFCFIVGMWISLERPPMRTMGEDNACGTLSFFHWQDSSHTAVGGISGYSVSVLFCHWYLSASISLNRKYITKL